MDEMKDAERRNHEVLHFWGHSDDCIEVEGDLEGCDEYYANQDDQATFVVRMPDGEAFGVTAIYTPGGTWSFTPFLGMERDRTEAPTMPLYGRIEINENGYSLDLVLEVPKGTVVEQVTDE